MNEASCATQSLLTSEHKPVDGPRDKDKPNQLRASRGKAEAEAKAETKTKQEVGPEVESGGCALGLVA
jgi:hypothetical protein